MLTGLSQLTLIDVRDSGGPRLLDTPPWPSATAFRNPYVRVLSGDTWPY